MERDKREFQRAQVKLDQRVTNLEHILQRKLHTRASERQNSQKRKCSFSRSRSLEVLDEVNKSSVQAARSMDEVDYSGTVGYRTNFKPNFVYIDNDNNSESSDEESRSQETETLKGNNLTCSSASNYNILSASASPRYRGGVYSPTDNSNLEINSKCVGNTLNKDTKVLNDEFCNNISTDDSRFHPEMKYVEFTYLPYYKSDTSHYYEQSLTSKLTKLRLINNSKNDTKNDEKVTALDSNYVTTHIQDFIDRDTNNDSGYSTKVYGSSKGNSPNLSGQIDSECLGASSLV